MTEKKTIQINGYYFRALFITLILSYLIIFATQHFGSFKYSHYQKRTLGEPIKGIEGARRVYYDWNRDDPVTSITFNTVLGSKLIFPSEGWRIKDLEYLVRN